MITIFINHLRYSVPQGSTVLEVCQDLNFSIPRFCFHENLNIAGNCRMCLVELKGSPKPVVSCALPAIEGMEIFTQTPLVRKAQEGVLELLLINHPLDCPICDQGGECDLQEQTLHFGSDRSRFFEEKRGVEDKNFGPFVKTIMTRCIHCTRCVRFIQKYGDGELGTTGRGENTEISFYISRVFTSEFSGNIIDLCPVGALTSKPYAFRARPWELKQYNSIDLLDGVGSNLKVNVFCNEIVRIVPNRNRSLNLDWISDRSRFFFDSLKYQRLLEPMMMVEDGSFKKISWDKALFLICQKLQTIDGSRICGVIGNLTNLQEIFVFKQWMENLGSKEVFYHTKKGYLNNDLLSNTTFSSLEALQKHDLLLFVNCNLQKEAPILNLLLKDRFTRGNFEIYSIGPSYSSIYPLQHLSSSPEILLQFCEGRHFLCKKIRKKRNPVFLFGNSFNTDPIFALCLETIRELFTHLFPLYAANINIVNQQASFLNSLEVNFESSRFSQRIDFLYLFNTENFNNFFNKIFFKKRPFTVYQGHHLVEEKIEGKVDLLLPGMSFFEKGGTFFNIEGRYQQGEKLINISGLQREDQKIFQMLFITFRRHVYKTISFGKLFTNREKISHPFLIKTFPVFFNSFPVHPFKPVRRKETILEKFSKILASSKGFLKKITNFPSSIIKK